MENLTLLGLDILKTQKTKKHALIILALFFLMTGMSEAYTPEKLRLGAVTGANPVYIVKQWRSLMASMEEATGLPVELVLRENYLDLLDAMKNGEVDLVEGGAFLYAQMHEKIGAQILIGELRKASPYYHALIVVRSDSGIDSINDLRGKSFTFTDPDSASGYLYPRIMLADAGVSDPENYFSSTYFSRHHDIALNAILNGTVDAAGIGDFFLPLLSKSDLKKIKIIARSEDIPAGPISYKPDLSQKIVDQLRPALIDLHTKLTPEQIKEMTVDQFVPVSEDIYDPLRQKVRQLNQLPPITDSIKYRTAPQKFISQIDAIMHRWQIIISIPICALILAVVFSFIIFRNRAAKSLKVKMIFAFISISVVILTTFSASTILDLRTKIRKVANEYLWDIKSFEAGCANAISEDKLPLLSVYTDEFASRQNIVYTRIIRNGAYVTDSMHRDSGKNIYENVRDGKFFLAGTLGQPMIETTDPMVVGDRMWGMIQTGFSLLPIRSLVVRTFAANIITILVATALSVALAYFLSNHITGPLAKLIYAIRNAGKGELLPVEIASRDDIGQLASAFEKMRTDLKVKEDLLKSKMEELNTAQAQLQEIYRERERVENRVKELEEKLADIDEQISSEENIGEMDDLEKSRRDIEIEYGAKQQKLKEMDSLVPPSYTELNGLKDKMASIEKLRPELKTLRETIIIGTSPAFTRTVRDIYIRSQDPDPVLIYGESGSGKTGTAHAMHKLSDRADKPFGEFNCAEFASADPMIVLGKLFGYGKDCGIQGIPREGQTGLLQKYDTGTLFLDEVTSLPLHAQALLLLPLEGRPFNPAAGHGPSTHVNVRFIFASNTPLLSEVEKGRFRKDLIRRMQMRGVIGIPPLRERREDIPLLAHHFLGQWVAKTGHKMEIANECMEFLKKWEYKSFNVGELSSIIRVAADQAYFDGKSKIEIPQLPPEMQSGIDLSHLPKIPDGLGWADETEARELAVLRKNRFLIASAELALGYPKNSKTLTNHFRGLCYKVLCQNGWQVKPAAAMLVGEAPSQDIVSRVWRKAEQYLESLKESITAGDEKRLLNNLPQKYHHYVEEAAKRFRKA